VLLRRGASFAAQKSECMLDHVQEDIFCNERGDGKGEAKQEKKGDARIKNEGISRKEESFSIPTQKKGVWTVTDPKGRGQFLLKSELALRRFGGGKGPKGGKRGLGISLTLLRESERTRKVESGTFVTKKNVPGDVKPKSKAIYVKGLLCTGKGSRPGGFGLGGKSKKKKWQKKSKKCSGG